MLFRALDRLLTRAPDPARVAWIGQGTYAHRGLHKPGVPENSLAAFAGAIAAGYGVEGERVDDPNQLGAALDRCLRRVEGGQPYLLDIEIERRYGGADSDWYDFFSVARGEPRRS